MFKFIIINLQHHKDCLHTTMSFLSYFILFCRNLELKLTTIITTTKTIIIQANINYILIYIFGLFLKATPLLSWHCLSGIKRSAHPAKIATAISIIPCLLHLRGPSISRVALLPISHEWKALITMMTMTSESNTYPCCCRPSTWPVSSRRSLVQSCTWTLAPVVTSLGLLDTLLKASTVYICTALSLQFRLPEGHHSASFCAGNFI